MKFTGDFKVLKKHGFEFHNLGSYNRKVYMTEEFPINMYSVTVRVSKRVMYIRDYPDALYGYIIDLLNSDQILSFNLNLKMDLKTEEIILSTDYFEQVDYKKYRVINVNLFYYLNTINFINHIHGEEDHVKIDNVSFDDFINSETIILTNKKDGSQIIAKELMSNIPDILKQNVYFNYKINSRLKFRKQ